MIGTIAVIIWLNFILFMVGFILGLCRFLKKCPMCKCCKRRLITKEPMIRDPDRSIDRGPKDEMFKPPTPIKTPTPTPSIETPPPEPEKEKTPTPESSESEPEIIIQAAAVLVKDN